MAADMESDKRARVSLLNIPAFWKSQQRDWRITVVRTSLDRLGYQVIYPYLSIYIVALGADKTDLGVITSLSMILAGLLGPYTGRFIDRNGPKKIYLAGIAMLIVAYLAYALAPVWQVAAVAMIVYYLASGTSGHSCATICGNCLANCDRAKGMLICESLAAGLLGMIGPMLASFILVDLVGVTGTPSVADDMRPLFYVPVLTSVVSFLLVLRMLSNNKWAATGTRTNLLKDARVLLRGNKNTKKWIIIGAMNNLPLGMVLPYTQLFAAEVKGADVRTLAAMVTAAAVTSVVCGYPVGALSDRFGRKKVLYCVMALFWCANIALVLAPSNAMLLVAGVLNGFYYISSPLAATIQREIVPQKLMGRWIGLNRIITAVFTALMAAVSGVIYDRMGARWVFLIYVAIDVFVRFPLLLSMPETLHYQVDEAAFDRNLAEIENGPDGGCCR